MTIRPERILMLYVHYDPLNKTRLTIQEHLRALETSDTPHQIVYFNAIQAAPAWLGRLNFTAVILHYSLLSSRMWPRDRAAALRRRVRWVATLDCPRIAVPQDEFVHSGTLDEWLHELNVQVVCSCFDRSHAPVLYPTMHTRAAFYHVFTGYIDPAAARKYTQHHRLIKDRPNDIIYRARGLAYWYGHQGQLKASLGDYVAGPARARGLVCDVSTRAEDTIHGEKWIDFMASGKVVLGCESGLGTLDRYGEIEQQVKALLADNPALTFEQVSARMPTGWDSHRFFAISPRHFEAVLTKTCQVLIEGDYDGVLQPNVHYIPLKRDFSNLDEVLDKIRDHDLLQRIADRAYEDIYLSGKYTYRTLTSVYEDAIQSHPSPNRQAPTDGISWQLGAPLAGSISRLSLNTYLAKRSLYRLLKQAIR